ncbi:hypothetical protein DNI29_04385 [Hymenobacter sediminis]|uniref:BC1872 family protein n=1 Tax=Hymenobacter sediminis TaxID=2218621 RepID=UPI000DA66B6B|nr:hypothetical protein [Hymenobacter sediminis]RPD50041.1 hypothetical protein DNI29_04385 [Hymenobacter sediminis]
MELTREQIEQMPAGREMDILLAKMLYPERNFDEDYTREPGKGNWYMIPNYSTYIAAAWKIIEHFETKGYLIDLTRAKDFETGEYPYVAEVWDIQNGPGRETRAANAPLAICRVALLTIAHEFYDIG